MNRSARNLYAGLAFVLLMVVTGFFDLILALEAGLISIFVALLVSQTATWWKYKSNTRNHAIGVVIIFVIGSFIYLQLVVVAAYVVAAHTSMETSTRLREIVIALHNWHQEHDAFPAVASYAADGKPLLSWRVHLLPYLGHEELYKRFRLDESWDSPHNVSLLPKLPECYRLPQYGRQAPWGGTFYQLIVGPGAVFQIDKQATLPQIAARGRIDSTLILGVALEAVPWTKPADLVFEENRPLALGKVMSHAPTPVASLLPWWNEELGRSNGVYRIAYVDGSMRSTFDEYLNMLGPYILWQEESPKDLDIIQ